MVSFFSWGPNRGLVWARMAINQLKNNRITWIKSPSRHHDASLFASQSMQCCDIINKNPLKALQQRRRGVKLILTTSNSRWLWGLDWSQSPCQSKIEAGLGNKFYLDAPPPSCLFLMHSFTISAYFQNQKDPTLLPVPSMPFSSVIL